MSSDYRDPTTWRNFTTSKNIPYRILGHSGEFTEEGGSISQDLLVEANQVYNLATEFFPPALLIGEFFVTPKGAPYSLTLPQFRAKRVSWKAHIDGLPIDPFGVDSDAPSAAYGKIAEVSIQYEASKDNNKDENKDDPTTFLEISSKASGEFITTNAPAGKWVDDSNAIPGQEIETDNKRPTMPVTITIPEIEWTVRWPNIPDGFFGEVIRRMRQTLGRVNSETLGILYNAPAETLLFVGWSHSEEYTWRTEDPDDAIRATLELSFLEKHIQDGAAIYGHNHFWKDGEGWQKLMFDGTNYVYKSFDFSLLFATSFA